MMKNSNIKRFLPALSVVLMVLGCSFPTFLQPTPTATATQTQDIVAISLSRTPRQDATEIIILPTATATPPSTPTPLPTETITITATLVPCNWVQYVSDLSYPDDSQVVTDGTFVKTWRLKNIGTCTWNSNYRLVFAEGFGMGLPEGGVPITNGSVPPGSFVDVSVTLKAPSSTGTHQGFFRLRAPDGTLFGIGPKAKGTFWVKIESVHPTHTPTITPTDEED